MTGAAIAAPVPVLEMDGAGRTLLAPLLGDRFAYTYRQSIYGVLVREELRVTNGGIRIDKALSPDIRALEYFRWPGKAVDAGGTLAWDAPDNVAEQLRIHVDREGEQRIETARATVLRDAFGDDASVTVRPSRRPLVLWVWALRPWA